VAWRKVCALKDAGGKVIVVSPEFCPELEKEEDVELIRKEYEEGFLKDAVLVIASTDDEEVNKRIYYDAEDRGILVNVVDRPSYCSFIVPSSVIHGDFCITISTGGASPSLSRNIRLQLEEQYGHEYGEFVELLSEMRKKVISEVEEESIRRVILKRIAELDMLKLIKDRGVFEVRKAMLNIILEKTSQNRRA